jgi:NHLM bacteriocin system ABC transporter ATP-binding protein
MTSEDSSQGSASLEAIARASQLRLRRIRLTNTWWQYDGGPLLAYTQEDHRPVALLPISATRYALFDPVSRTRTPVSGVLAATLASDAYVLYRPLPSTISRLPGLLRFGLKGCGKNLFIAGLTGLAVTLLGMLMPHAMSLLVDKAIPDADRALVLQLGVALLAVAGGQALLQLAQGFALLRQQTAAGAAIQTALWDRLLQLPPAFFRQYASGDLHARVSVVSSIQQKVNETLLRTLFTSVWTLLNLGLMCYYSMTLALVAGGVAVVAALITACAGMLTARQVRPLQQLSGTLLGMVVQLINGVAKIRVAGAEERAFASWGNAFSLQQTLLRRLQRIADTLTVLNTVLPTLATALLFGCALGIWQSDAAPGRPGLTPGIFLAFHAAFGTFLAGVTTLSNTLIEVWEVVPLWERARPIVMAIPEVDRNLADPGKLTGKLALDHVTFRYQARGPTVLHDISIQAEPGEFIALVGPSGSGKSTIVRLLLGFDTPETGAVSYDDHNLRRLDVTAVRRQMGTVLQHSAITAATIFDNIASGRLITLDDAWYAARAAGLAEEITAMPMGMHTFIGEGGSNLSGGQRQRLLIARALVHRPAIVLFDEATSALDNRAQAMVTASLDNLRVTRVVIAHRLSTIRHADRIYVIAGGRIVQQGRFHELAEQDGLFAQLMARQKV